MSLSNLLQLQRSNTTTQRARTAMQPVSRIIHLYDSPPSQLDENAFGSSILARKRAGGSLSLNGCFCEYHRQRYALALTATSSPSSAVVSVLSTFFFEGRRMPARFFAFPKPSATICNMQGCSLHVTTRHKTQKLCTHVCTMQWSSGSGWRTS